MSEPSTPRTELNHTPLEAEHRALGARMIAFAGWSMPLEYTGTLAEHLAVRERVGLFDLTHLGTVMVSGEGALDVVQRVLTNDVSKVGEGAAQYNLCLNEQGGIVDDLIVYRVSPDRYLVVPNAANTDTVWHRLAAAAGGVDVVLLHDVALVAPQGPRSFDLVDQIFPGASGLGYMQCTEMPYRGRAMVVSRTGYTGERGFELFVPSSSAVQLWHECLSRGAPLGIEPAGLGARDTLRLEMGYPLHGNDISESRTPLEAGLSWAVSFDKGDFTGREALLRQKDEGIPSRLWGLRMQDRLIPRPHYAVRSGDEQVGETTSGTFSPTLKLGIALAYLSPRDRFNAGDEVTIDVRGRRGTAEIVRPPFVDASPK